MVTKIAIANLRMAGLDRPAEEWSKAGHEVVFVKAPPPPKLEYGAEDFASFCGEADILVNDGRQYISGPIMDLLPQLRAVVVPFIGVDKIDVGAATTRNILVVNSPSEDLIHSVAEATILLMLALAKRLRHEENILRAGKLNAPEDRNDMLWGRTVGIIGCGRTGRGIAQRLRGWNMRILAYDPYLSGPPPEFQDLVEMVDLETLLRSSDYVAVQAVLTDETYHMISERELKLMKPTAYLINTARGAIVDEEAVVRAVENNVIAGAGLDTFETEPLPMESPLRRLDQERVILTPHILPHSNEAIAGNMRLLTNNVLKLAVAEVPEQVVNKSVIPAWEKRFSVGVKSPQA